jgi:hypothetical protein
VTVSDVIVGRTTVNVAEAAALLAFVLSVATA